MSEQSTKTTGPQVVRVAVAVVEHAGQYLIGQRPAGTALAGLWEFPGGKRLPDESGAQAAERETVEETGLQVRAVGSHDVVTHAYDHATVEVTFVACHPTIPLSEPRDPFRWVPVAELVNYEFPAANATLIRKLVDASAAQKSPA
ncbi:MAG TPA: (deoxy)nucleoside triphosphate pyrophosphohydrolase [Pirellulales bacterium]|jgi:mutator protein MutT